jgi:hypothetical protein
MDSCEISKEFARAFCSADLVRLEALLHPKLHLRGPLIECHTRDEYLQTLRSSTLEPAGCVILQVNAGANEAAILYEYRKPVAPVLVAQFNRLQDGLISEIELVFDTARLSS